MILVLTIERGIFDVEVHLFVSGIQWPRRTDHGQCALHSFSSAGRSLGSSAKSLGSKKWVSVPRLNKKGRVLCPKNGVAEPKDEGFTAKSLYFWATSVWVIDRQCVTGML